MERGRLQTVEGEGDVRRLLSGITIEDRNMGSGIVFARRANAERCSDDCAVPPNAASVRNLCSLAHRFSAVGCSLGCGARRVSYEDDTSTGSIGRLDYTQLHCRIKYPPGP